MELLGAGGYWMTAREEGTSENQGVKPGDSSQGYLLRVFREARCFSHWLFPAVRAKRRSLCSSPEKSGRVSVWADPAGLVPKGLRGSRGP